MLNMGELFAHPRVPNIEMARVNISQNDPERTLLAPNDLVFARRSLTLEGAGKCSIIREVGEPTTWESSIIRARLEKSQANASFFYYYFASPQGRISIETIVEQVAAAGIRITDLARLEVPCPPLPEQQAIADVLGALDDKIAANTKLARAATALASLSFDVATAGIAKKPMSQVLLPVLGATPSRSRPDLWVGEHLWISAKDVTSAPSGVVIETVEKISAAATTSTRAKPLPTGSVILTARGTVGAVARLGAPSSFNQSCYGFVPDRLPAGVLYFAIQRAADQARSLAHGSVFDTITMKTFDHVAVPNPEAAGIGELNAKIEPLLDMVTASVLENRTLSTTRDTLLPQLMSGTLRVRDAEKIVAEAV